MNQLIASSLVTLCFIPIFPGLCLRLATRYPGLINTTKKSIPKIPVPGSYFKPRSICSVIPNPKQPVAEKFLFFNSYSLTFKPRSRISLALKPRTVTNTAIFSFLLIPNERTVYLALE